MMKAAEKGKLVLNEYNEAMRLVRKAVTVLVTHNRCKETGTH